MSEKVRLAAWADTKLRARIDRARKKEKPPESRSHWILGAILEKLEKEKK